ncbi:hypothetical protein BKA70DRAFT_1313944 [Coprinopsis sp. MPI-PUGE-AT-0042]|nr:hypothetical protein BKA70DRAFT_1313944 [Coprinopsis sp. MPI-PUGE-AT-0042]
MSNPGTAYPTREKVQRMICPQDPIRGLQKYLEEWGVVSEQGLKIRSIALSDSCRHLPLGIGTLAIRITSPSIHSSIQFIARSLN